MNERAAFIRAICANPADDVARLVYADWLDEIAGEPTARGEFIRVQCEMHRMEACGEHWHFRDESYDKVEDRKYGELRRREKELWMGVCTELFTEGMPMQGLTSMFDSKTTTVRNGQFEFHYSRGFISHVTCTAELWLQHADALVWHEGMTDACPDTAQPIEKVKLTTEVRLGVGGPGWVPGSVFIEAGDQRRIIRLPEDFKDVLGEEDIPNVLKAEFGKGIEFELP